MRVVFFLACWKRPEITELCFMGLKRLMKHDKVNASAFAVISEESMIPLCKKYGIEYLMYENIPVGRKKNAGLDEVLKKDFDYMIELGSDDVIQDKLIDHYLPFMEIGEDFFGSRNFCFIDGPMGQCMEWQCDPDPNFNPGLGRCMSKKLLMSMSGKVMVKANVSILSDANVISEGESGFLEPDQAETFSKLGWAEILPNEIKTFMWGNMNRGLDNDSSARIFSKGYKFKWVETPEPLMADIKSDENIWMFNPELGKPYDLEKFLNGLSKEEKAYYFQLQKKLKAKRIEKAA